MFERNNPKPLYQQLEDLIRSKIESEEWKPDNAIPSENELSKTCGLSRMTVRAVLTQFVREGLLYRVQGKGTFVSQPKITTRTTAYTGIREQLEQMGYEITTRLLNIEQTSCSDAIAKKLQIASGNAIFVIERVRFIREEPLSIHYSYIPAELCGEIEDKNLEEEQLCVILRRDYGLAPAKVVQTLESTMARSNEAKILKIKSGFPLLMLEDIIFSAQDNPFEYSKVVFRGDKVKLRFEYTL